MEFKWSKGTSDFNDAAQIRQEVFVREQGFEDEFDSDDKEALHLLLYVADQAVATARLVRLTEEMYKIGRVAVLIEHRGKHYGEAVMGEAIKKAASLGAITVELGAQKHAEQFYVKLGFVSQEPYFEQGCAHVHMVMKI